MPTPSLRCPLRLRQVEVEQGGLVKEALAVARLQDGWALAQSVAGELDSAF